MKKWIYIVVYSCLISFLTFCNEKKNFILVAKEINTNEKLKQYEDNYNNDMKSKLCQIIKNYCSYYEIGFYDKIDSNKEKFKEALQDELNEFNCFIEVCKPREEIFQKFIIAYKPYSLIQIIIFQQWLKVKKIQKMNLIHWIKI